MAIRTGVFTLTRDEYFKLLVVENVTMLWKNYVLAVVLLVVLGLLMRSTWWTIGGVAVIALLPFFRSFFEARARDNALLYQRRHFEIDGEFIHQYFEDGSSSQIRLENIVHAVKRRSFYLLYLSRAQFTLLAESAFSEADREAFEALLRSRGLLRSR